MSELKIDKVSPRTGNYVSLNTVGMKNIIINGDMSIAQRGTSFTGLTDDAYTLDRFQYALFGSSGHGTYTVSQDTDIPSGQGFATSMKIDCTTADASLASDVAIVLRQRVEGQNLQYLKYGTANAESLTLSFWIKSNLTGTGIINIFNANASRHIAATYTIDVTNTWEKKTITFAGDTVSGFTNNTGTSMEVRFYLAAGSDFTSGTLATSWSSRVATNDAVGITLDVGSSTSNEFYITGVQLEAGTTASDFEFLPVDVNLQRCLRYFYKWVSTNLYNNICIGRIQSATLGRGVFAFPQIMRATPSLSADGNFRVIGDQTLTLTGSGVSLGRANTNNIYIEMLGSGTGSTTSYACEMGANNDADAEIAFSAEL
jgi:hypothetical protein